MASSTDTVAAFEGLMKRMQSHAASEDLTSTLLAEISTALADILACMEKPEKGDTQEEAQAMGRAFAAALATLKMPTPEVTVAAPQITVQAPPEREHPAPNIVINPVIASPSGSQWSIELAERDMNTGRARKFIVTKL